MTHVIWELTAKNRDQLRRNHTLGNRVWATFTFYLRPAGSDTKLLPSILRVRTQWQLMSACRGGAINHGAVMTVNAQCYKLLPPGL